MNMKLIVASVCLSTCLSVSIRMDILEGKRKVWLLWETAKRGARANKCVLNI